MHGGVGGNRWSREAPPYPDPTLAALAPTSSPLQQQRFFAKATSPAPEPSRIVPSSQAIRRRNSPVKYRGVPTEQSDEQQGRYLLRSNMTGEDPAALWHHYMQLTEIEQAFKELKHNLAIRPIFHQLEQRIEAHIFVSFIAYCLLVTLKNLARPQAPGLTPRAIVEKFAAIQMVDLHVPTADGRHLVLARHTQPSEDHELLLRQLDLALPKQPAPKLLS